MAAMTVKNYSVKTTSANTPAYTCPSGRIAKIFIHDFGHSSNPQLAVKFSGSASGSHMKYTTSAVSTTYGRVQDSTHHGISTYATGAYMLVPTALILTPGDHILMPKGSFDNVSYYNTTSQICNLTVIEIDLPT